MNAVPRHLEDGALRAEPSFCRLAVHVCGSSTVLPLSEERDRANRDYNRARGDKRDRPGADASAVFGRALLLPRDEAVLKIAAHLSAELSARACDERSKGRQDRPCGRIVLCDHSARRDRSGACHRADNADCAFDLTPPVAA